MRSITKEGRQRGVGGGGRSIALTLVSTEIYVTMCVGTGGGFKGFNLD